MNISLGVYHGNRTTTTRKTLTSTIPTEQLPLGQLSPGYLPPDFFFQLKSSSEATIESLYRN